jgi:F0F1-type ATP synthase delta subunit
MRYSIQNYAKALAEAAMSAHDTEAALIRKNFLELLRRSGDEAHLPKIVTEAERIMRAKDSSKRIVVSIARKQKQSAHELVKHLAGPHDAVEERIDPSLIAGMKVTVNNEMMFDGSLKTKLGVMFGNI